MTQNLFEKSCSGTRRLPFVRKIGYSPEQMAKIEFRVTSPQAARWARKRIRSGVARGLRKIDGPKAAARYCPAGVEWRLLVTADTTDPDVEFASVSMMPTPDMTRDQFVAVKQTLDQRRRCHLKVTDQRRT